MSSGDVYETLFRQWASVSKLVVDGKRDSAKVSKVLQDLIDEPCDSYERARLILGKDFISAKEISHARGVSYSDEQLKTFTETLPSESVLTWLRDNGCTLVAGPPNPMSLLDIWTIKPKYFYAKSGGWYQDDSQKFSRNDKVATAWLGLCKALVPNSTNKKWDEQSVLLTEVERVPNAAEFAWGVTSYKAVRGAYLFKGMYARTSSVSLGGSRVDLGGFGQFGLGVNGYWDDNCSNELGVASARIFNPA